MAHHKSAKKRIRRNRAAPDQPRAHQPHPRFVRKVENWRSPAATRTAAQAAL